MTEEKPFFTGQYCECGGELWSKDYSYECRDCKKHTIMSPKIKLNVKKIK